MKKRIHGVKKIVGVLLVASMCVSLGITVFAIRELTPNEAEKKTLYVVNSESSKNREDERKATFGEQNVISEMEVTDKIVKEYSNLVIEEEALDEEIQKTLREAFENETKIFVTGNITANAIREYFGLDTVEAVAEDVREVGETAKQEEDDVRYVDVSLFPTVGRLIYQDWRGTNITTVKSSNSEHWKDPTGLIEKCFNYDYLYNTTGVEKAKRRAGADTWSRVDVITDGELAVEQKNKVFIKLDGKSHKGEAQSAVIEGEGVSAVVTVNFAYEGDQGCFSITSIDSATAENDYGWVYVDREVTIDADHICYGAHRSEVAVPIVYRASLGGSGAKEYEGLIHVDLSSVVEE